MSSQNTPSLARALLAALKAVQLRPEDEAAVALAKRYARVIDADEEQIGKLGRELLTVLAELGMTPRARAAVVGKGVGTGDRGGQPSRADELRERRARRGSRVDTAQAGD